MPSLKQALIKEIEKIPEVTNKPSLVAGGSALFFRDKEFGHFHHDQELDLKLSKKLIRQEKLSHPADSKVHPSRSSNSPWIELRLESLKDVKEVARLVKLAVSVIR